MMANGVAPVQKQTPQQIFDSLSWRFNNLDTKVRINEQNLLNMRKHSQLINQNFLDLKKEIRESVVNIQKTSHDMERKVNELSSKLNELESRLTQVQKTPFTKAKAKKPHEELAEKSADQILDEILEGKY